MGTLGRIDLMQPEDLDSGVQKMNMFASAMQEMANRGLVFPAHPGQYAGQMPHDLVALTDEQLGQYLNMAGAWCAYVEAELAKASAARECAKAEMEFVRARVRIAIKASDDKKLTAKDKDDLVETDPRVTSARSKELYTEAIYDMTKALREKAQRDWETISRRITQRGQEVERMRRQVNVEGIPMSGRTFRRGG